MARSKKSAPFPGVDVVGTTVAIRNAGDGLSKAMEVDTPDLQHFQTVHVLLECEVVDIQTPKVKDTDHGVQVKFVLKAGRATIVDDDFALGALDEMTKRLEDAVGTQRIPGVDEPVE